MYLQASDLFNERITKSGRTFHARLISGNEVVDSGFSSINIYGGSNNGDTITIGSAISQRIEVEMKESDIKLAGKEWVFEMGLLLESENIEYIQVGYFTPEKPSTDNGKTKFTAYDRMMKLSGIYSCTLSVINTIAVLNDISTQTGVPIDVTGLAALQMNKPEGYTCREVLMYIAQKYGKFANVNRAGIIQLHWWTEVKDYKITPNNTNGFSHDENIFTLGYILCSTGQNEEGNAIVITAGKGTQGISISNPFMAQNELDEVYGYIGGFTYTVSNVNMPIGDPRLDPWDIVEVYDTKGNAYKIPLMSLEFQYDGGLSASFSCVGYSETESETDYKGPMTQFQERLEASIAKIGILIAKSASIEDLEALRIRVDNITSVEITTEYLEANYASLDDLLAVSAKINRIQSDYINTINLESKVAELGYAKIDFSNVSVENVGKLFADIGILTNVTIVDGYITGILNGVKINADVITAGTLAVDRLLVTGKDSIVYQLNVESSGLSAEELEKEVYQKYLNGTDIVANSITANQIAAETITAKEIAANAITTAKIASGAITTDKLEARAVTAAKIDVNDLFAQNITATGTITGANLIGATGNFEGSVTANEIYVNTGINFYIDGNKENKIPAKLVQVKTVGAAAGTRYLSLVAGVENSINISSGNILRAGLTIEGGADIYGNLTIGSDDSGDMQPGDIYLEKYNLHVGEEIRGLKSSVSPLSSNVSTLLARNDLRNNGSVIANKTLSNGTNTNIGSFSIPSAGTYMIVITATFNANSTSSYSSRQVWMSESSGGGAYNYQSRYRCLTHGSISTECQFVTFVNTSSAKTFYVVGYQGSGANMTVVTRYSVLKLR